MWIDNKNGKEKCSWCGLMAAMLYSNDEDIHRQLACKDCLQKTQRKHSLSYKVLLCIAPVIAIIITILFYLIFLNKD